MACTDSKSNSKIVEGVLCSVAKSDNFLLPSMRTDNAKKLARELLLKIGAPGGSDNSIGTCYIDKFSKFSCALIDKILKRHRSTLILH